MSNSPASTQISPPTQVLLHLTKSPVLQLLGEAPRAGLTQIEDEVLNIEPAEQPILWIHNTKQQVNILKFNI